MISYVVVMINVVCGAEKSYVVVMITEVCVVKNPYVVDMITEVCGAEKSYVVCYVYCGTETLQKRLYFVFLHFLVAKGISSIGNSGRFSQGKQAANRVALPNPN